MTAGKSSVKVPEKGSSLQEYAEYAKNWFIENNVSIPSQARQWQARTVAKGELPPGLSYGFIVHNCSFTGRQLIDAINGKDSDGKYGKKEAITKENCLELTGLHYISHEWAKGHKRIHTKCDACDREESLDYGTLQRMIVANNKFCRYCRNAGGKPKDLETYNVFKGFTAKSYDPKFQRVKYECDSCKFVLERSLTHVREAEYIRCDNCNPSILGKTTIETEYGRFGSKIEFEVFKTLLEYLAEEDILRQVKYDDLLNTRTKHTVDFYIPKLSLMLEVTTPTSISERYAETKAWKLKQSDMVKFAHSIKEAEDIVRSLLKGRE